MQSNPASGRTSLAVVIPVYNEQQRIDTLLDDWLPVFEKTAEDFRVILIDDGSKDDSLKMLQLRQAKDPRLEVYTQANAGHGPAILRGYRLAADAEWVFQIDSDHQLDTLTFVALWNQRYHVDFLLGCREEKNASGGRKFLSGWTSSLVSLLYGKTVQDVNSPYRLMRGEMLQEALKKIPADSFAPNVLLTAWFTKKRKAIFTLPVELRTQDQRKSKLNPYILRGAIRSGIQTILFRIKI